MVDQRARHRVGLVAIGQTITFPRASGLSPRHSPTCRRRTAVPLPHRPLRRAFSRIAVTLATIGVGIAAAAAALGFGALTLGVQPAPAAHTVVMPAPHQPAVIGTERLHAPHLVDSEIASGLRKQVQRNQD
jgi:hypothetical protein